MYDVPRSNAFDDIYFSVENGAEESEFVFFKGNNLPQSWDTNSSYTIAETGFGTGLNFFLAWELLEKNAPDLNLKFISYEMYPLDAEEIRKGLSRWGSRFENKIEKFLSLYPEQTKTGKHTLEITPSLTLHLYIGDVNECLPVTQDVVVDAWFLDGFTPAKNPLMWTDTVFKNMARLSKEGTSFATFTSAGFVKRGLQAAGFDVEKTEGFGRKRERLIGKFTGEAASK